jgi:hypothetical protein
MTTSINAEPVPAQMDVKVYPNPSSGLVNVEFKQSAERYIQLVSMGGEVLREVKSQSAKAILHFGGYPPGMYLLQIFDAEGNVEGVQKILLQ